MTANGFLQSGGCGLSNTIGHRPLTAGRTFLSCFRRDQIRLFNSGAPGWQGRQGPAPEEASGVDPVVQLFQKGCKGYCVKRQVFLTGPAGYWLRGPTDLYFRRTGQMHRHSQCRSCSHFWHRCHQMIHRDADYLNPHGRWMRCRVRYTDNNLSAAGPERPSGRMPQAIAPLATPSERPGVRPGRPGANSRYMFYFELPKKLSGLVL